MSHALAGLGGLALLSRLQRFVVEGPSMLPALLPGDRLCLNPLTYRFREPRAGDIVVVRRHDFRQDVKRVAGVPGDEVEAPTGRRLLGADEWWLLGDNADASTDSRELGPVRRADIFGPVWFRY